MLKLSSNLMWQSNKILVLLKLDHSTRFVRKDINLEMLGILKIFIKMQQDYTFKVFSAFEAEAGVGGSSAVKKY